jgi:hypothetical protein
MAMRVRRSEVTGHITARRSDFPESGGFESNPGNSSQMCATISVGEPAHALVVARRN